MQSVAKTANYPAGVLQQYPERNLSIVTATSMVVQVTLFRVTTIGIRKIEGVKVEESWFVCVP